MATDRTPEMAALEVFVGKWTIRPHVPDAATEDTVHTWALDAPTGYTEFSWALEDRYLVQHSAVPNTPVPSAMSVYAPDGDGYLQHYFDSRGVVRLYRMSLRDGVWTLQRTTADFSPLDFAQRFVGTFSPDGDTIDGRWETSPDGGETWELDFGLSYTRVR